MCSQWEVCKNAAYYSHTQNHAKIERAMIYTVDTLKKCHICEAHEYSGLCWSDCILFWDQAKSGAAMKTHRSQLSETSCGLTAAVLPQPVPELPHSTVSFLITKSTSLCRCQRFKQIWGRVVPVAQPYQLSARRQIWCARSFIACSASISVTPGALPMQQHHTLFCSDRSGLCHFGWKFVISGAIYKINCLML